MRDVIFDVNALRSFVTGVELGNFSKAAERLGRSTSAISNQLKKLEDQAGTTILQKSGRGLELTEAGETLLAYARRLLDINAEAVGAIRGLHLEGSVRLGMQQDFGETLLSDVLGRFARAHPKVKIEACIARNGELTERIVADRLDLALAWNNGIQGMHHRPVVELPMSWVGQKDFGDFLPENLDEPVPLALIDAPCLFRDAAMEALDRASIPWRIAFTSPSLGGLWGAVSAGLGVSLRTPIGLPSGVVTLDPDVHGLPKIRRDIVLSILSAEASMSAEVARLGDIVEDAVKERVIFAG